MISPGTRALARLISIVAPIVMVALVWTLATGTDPVSMSMQVTLLKSALFIGLFTATWASNAVANGERSPRIFRAGLLVCGCFASVIALVIAPNVTSILTFAFATPIVGCLCVTVWHASRRPNDCVVEVIDGSQRAEFILPAPR